MDHLLISKYKNHRGAFEKLTDDFENQAIFFLQHANSFAIATVLKSKQRLFVESTPLFFLENIEMEKTSGRVYR